MRTRGLVAFCIAISVILLSVAVGFASAPVFLTITDVDSTDFPGISVFLNAWDSNGIPLEQLTVQNVYIREDDGAEIHPESVQPLTDAQLSVVLVMDVSGSMVGEPLADAQGAANRFLDRLGKSDQAALIAFSSNVNTDPADLIGDREVGFSNDLTAAYDLIDGLQAGGGTEVYNAVEKAVRMASSLPSGHRAVLLFTDGKNDPVDVGAPDNAINLAKENQIPIFVIGLGSEIDEDYLQRITSETGGFYRSTPRSSELSTLFTDMATLLKTSYILTYQSGIEDGNGLHELKVRLVSPQGEGVANSTLNVAIPISPTKTAIVLDETAVEAPDQVTTPDSSAAEPQSIFERYKWVFLIGLAVIVLMIVILRIPRNRTKEVVEKCANCGAELSEDGPCPICKSTKRITIKK